jgi:hypothetical protein
LRIWDIHPSILCRQHLLAEHRELHCIWTVLTKGKKGYSKHPETLRWAGKLKALHKRHQLLVEELKRRNYSHKSPLDENLICGDETQCVFVNTTKEQIEILKSKKCQCRVDYS